MKISGLEKGVLALTLAFLLLTAGYFFLNRGGGQPYSVSTQTVWTGEIGANPSDSAETEPAVSTEKININTATAAQLESLPGIGEVRAAAIVADREANGPFRIPEDIMRVSGIGEGTLEEIVNYITVE